MVNRRPALPPELLKYAQGLYPDLPLQDDSEELPDIEEGIAQVEQDYAEQQQQKEAEMAEAQAEMMKNQLEPLEIDEEAEQQELEQQEMQKIQDRMATQQAEGQEAELDDFMKQQMELEAEAEKIPAKKESAIEVKRMPSYSERIMEATKERQKREDQINLLQNVSTLGSRVLGRTPDTTIYDQMKKKANRPVENLMLEKQLEQQELKDNAQNLILEQQAKDARAKNDPNSDISRAVRQALVDLGLKSLEDMPNVTYAQLEKLYPTLVQGLYTQFTAKANIERAKIAAVGKKLELLAKDKQAEEQLDLKKLELKQNKEAKDAELNLKKMLAETKMDAEAEAKVEKAKNKEDERKFKLANEARFRVKDLQDKDSPYTTYQKANDAVSNLDSLIMRFRKGEDPDKIAEGAAFFQYAKIAQGDSSVLRDSDIRNLAGGMDVTQFLDVLARKIAGAQFTEKDLRNMKKVMEVTRRVNKEKTYRLKIKPMLKWAKQNNYDLSENLDPDIVQQISADFIKAEQEAEVRKEKLKQLSQKAKASKKE